MASVKRTRKRVVHKHQQIVAVEAHETLGAHLDVGQLNGVQVRREVYPLREVGPRLRSFAGLPEVVSFEDVRGVPGDEGQRRSDRYLDEDATLEEHGGDGGETVGYGTFRNVEDVGERSGRVSRVVALAAAPGQVAVGGHSGGVGAAQVSQSR